MTDPVQVVDAARKAHQRIRFDLCACGEQDFRWFGNCPGERRHHVDHVNEAIVAALREAGLLAEGEVVGYASVLKKAEWKQWNFTGAGPYVSEVEARSNTKPYPVEGWESRVAALHLLPDTEEGLE